MSVSVEQRQFELENEIEQVYAVDEIFKYDAAMQSDILKTKPWAKDPNYFKYCKISALALLKMVIHARSGGNIEIMGTLLGKVDGETMIVMDCFALPVEGTETRVNAAAAAYEYMTQYCEQAQKIGRCENVIGWYHSHPGYGCWLSGIDVQTQMSNQQFQDPFLAIVVDPTRTISAGKVSLGAFRTYPKGYQPSDAAPSEYQTIPLNKIEDYGVHCKQYYALDVTYFKSTLDKRLLDLLWNKYWLDTLSSSALMVNASYITGQIKDLTQKLESSDLARGLGDLSRQSSLDPVSMPDFGSYPGPSKNNSGVREDLLAKYTADCSKMTVESLHGLTLQVLKHSLFNQTTNPGDKSQDMDKTDE